MALVLADRIKETTTTVGSGSITLLGAATGYRSFATVGNGNTTYYTIAGQTTGEWEVGIGTYTAAGTILARTTVLSSSNAGSLVVFSAGTKDVFVTYPAGKSVNLDANGGATIAAPTSGVALTLTAAGSSYPMVINDVAGAGVTWRNATNASGYDIGLLGGTTNADGYIWQRAAANLILGTNNNSRLTIGSAGNITAAAPTSGNTFTANMVSTGNGVVVTGAGGGGATLSTSQPSGTTNYWRLGQPGIVNWDIQNIATTGEFRITNGTQIPFSYGSTAGMISVASAVGNVRIAGASSGVTLDVQGAAQAVVADEITALKTIAATNLIRFRPYVTTLGASVIEATNVSEAAYTPLLFNGSSLSFYSAGASRQTINSSGNVTINGPTSGTALYVTQYPGSPAIFANGPIELNGVKGIGYIAASDTFTEGGLVIPNYGANWGNNTTISASVPSANISGYGGVGLFTSAARRLTISATGNVTINAPTSGDALTVNGVGTYSINVAGAASANGAIVLRGNGLAAGSGLFITQGSDTNSYITAQNNASLFIGTNNVSRVTVSNSGAVTINGPTSGNTLAIGAPVAGSYALTAASATLGTAINNQEIVARFNTNTGNQDYLEISNYRGSAGVTWETAGYRIQQKVDATWMGYIQFNRNNNGGIALGAGLSSTTPASVPDRLVIGTNGNVTINTPTSGIALTASAVSGQMALQLTGPTNYAQIQYIDGTVTAYSGIGSYAAASWNFGTASAHSSSWYTNGSARITVGSTGLVGIGATPAAWSGFVVTQVGVGAISNNNGGDYSNITTNAYWDGTNWRYIGASTATKYTQFIGTHSWHSAVSGTAGGVLSSWTRPLSITNTGNVDLDGATSGYTLRVTGGFAATFTDGTGNYSIQMSGGAAYVGTTSNHLISFRTNNTDRMYIAAAGNVVINAPGSGNALAVSGITGSSTYYSQNTTSGSSAEYHYQATNGTDSNLQILISQVGAASKYAHMFTATATPLLLGTNSTARVTIAASGTVMTVAGIYGTHSTKIADSATDLYDAGYLGIPQVYTTSAYSLTLSNRGKHIRITTGGVTVNASIFSAGDAVTIYNDSGSSQTITQGTSVTLRLGGTATTGSRTLAQYGVATILCVVGGLTPQFVVAGAGVS